MSETTYTKLELTFEPSSGPGYRLSMGFRAAGGDTDQRIPPVDIPLNPKALKDLAYDIDEYSQALTAQVFGQEASRTLFASARMLSQFSKSPLRIQVVISPAAPELHTIVWEALRDPQIGSLLSTLENVWFSRYLLSQDARLVSLRPRGELKALALAANPSDLASVKLAPVDADGEIARLQQALVGIPLTTLGNSRAPRATLNNLLDAAREGVDVLYLACHGTMTEAGPVLYLENDQGQMARLLADRFVESLAEIEKLPRLIVLASCESAGKEDPEALKRPDGALAALGPRLAEIGVPAVLAMHGKISMTTISQFMPAFFKELSTDGQVDHAISVARSLARNSSRPDAWMPVLFSRSISGRLWPEATPGGPTAAQMETLINEVLSLKERPTGGINIQGENITIQGGMTVGAAVNQAAPSPGTSGPVGRTGAPQAPFHINAQAMLGSTSRLAPNELRGMPRKFIHLQEFIDRVDEYRQFTKMVVDKVEQREKRIVAFYGQAGMGKSWLLDRIQFECVRNGIPCARINFESGNYNNVIEILRELAIELGKNEFDRWIKKDEFWHSPPEIKLDIKAGEAGAGVGANLALENASISGGVVLGANVDMRGSQFNVATRAANDPQAARVALTEMFISVLEDFVAERPAVLLFEGLDHNMCSAETRLWLIDTLLNRVRDLEGYGVLSVATFFDRPRLERSLELDTYESQLKPLQINHIIDYFRMRKIPENMVEPAAQACFADTQGIPARVYEHSELLIHTLDEVLREAEDLAQATAPAQTLRQSSAGPELTTAPLEVAPAVETAPEARVSTPTTPEPVLTAAAIPAPETPIEAAPAVETAPEAQVSMPEPVLAAAAVPAAETAIEAAPAVETAPEAQVSMPEPVLAAAAVPALETPVEAAPAAETAPEAQVSVPEPVPAAAAIPTPETPVEAAPAVETAPEAQVSMPEPVLAAAAISAPEMPVEAAPAVETAPETQVSAPTAPEPIPAAIIPAPETPVEAAAAVETATEAQVSAPTVPEPVPAAAIPAPETPVEAAAVTVPEAQVTAPTEPEPVPAAAAISPPETPVEVAPVIETALEAQGSAPTTPEPVLAAAAIPTPEDRVEPTATPEEIPAISTQTPAAAVPALEPSAADAASSAEILRRSLEKIQQMKDEGKSSLAGMVDHVLKAQSPQVAAVSRQCAVLRWFSLEVIIEIIGAAGTAQEAEAIVEQMLDWPFVQELSQQRYTYRAEVRQYLRQSFQKEDPQGFRSLLQRAHDYFERPLAGKNIFDDLVLVMLAPELVSSLREKLYYLLQLDLSSGFELLNALFQSAQRLSMLGEASTLLRFAQELDQTDLPELYRNRLAYYTAVLDFSSGEVEASLLKINDLLDSLSGRALDGELKTQILGLLGLILSFNRDYEQAISAFEQARKISKDLKREREAARLSNNLGTVYNNLREYDKAEQAFNLALSDLKRVGTLADQAQTLNNLGNVYRNRLAWKPALDFYQKSLAIKHQIGDQYGAVRTLINIGSAYANMAMSETGPAQVDLRKQALECLQTGRQTYIELGARSMQADVLRRLARLHLQNQQLDLARQSLNDALQLYTSLKMWAEIQSAETQSLAGSLNIPLKTISGSQSVGQAVQSAVQPGVSATQLLKRVSAAPVAATKPPVAAAKPQVATTKPPVAIAKPPVAAAKPPVQPVPAAAAPPRPAAPAPIDPLPALLQKLEAQSGPVVVMNVEKGLARLTPAAADLAKRAALLRVFDEPLINAIGDTPGEPAHVQNLLAQIGTLPFVQPTPAGLTYHSGEQAFLRESLRLENPGLFREIYQRAYQYFDSKTGSLEALKASIELPPPAYFTDLREKLYYQFRLDQPGGLQLLDELIPLLVEKANRLRALQDPTQNSKIKDILDQAAGLLAFARQEANLPGAGQDQLAYFEALLEISGGKPDLAETRLRALNEHTLENELKGQVLGQLGILQTNKGDYAAAAKYFEQAQGIWSKLKRDLENARVLNNLGTVYLRQKNFDRAEKSFQQALTGLAKAGSPAEQAQALNNLGNVHMLKENWGQSVDAYQKSLSIKQAAGDSFGIATTQTNLGMVFQRQAQGASGSQQAELRGKAVASFTAAVKIFRGLGARAQLGRAQFALSYLYFQIGQPDQARQILPEAIRIFKDLGLAELANASKLAQQLGL